jgi:hypothetical protein
MLAFFETIDKPLLNVVHREAITCFHDLFDPIFIIFVEFSPVAVVDGCLAEIVLSYSVVLSTVDETLQDWRPLSDERKHLPEA